MPVLIIVCCTKSCGVYKAYTGGRWAKVRKALFVVGDVRLSSAAPSHSLFMKALTGGPWNKVRRASFHQAPITAWLL
jgi:hypothetical protein